MKVVPKLRADLYRIWRVAVWTISIGVVVLLLNSFVHGFLDGFNQRLG